jgi:splicing factor 3B subunit 2
MGLSTAEKNKQKRDRKKKEKENRRKQQEESNFALEEKDASVEVEVEYVAERITTTDTMAEVLQKFQERAAMTTSVVSDDEVQQRKEDRNTDDSDDDDDDDDGQNTEKYSKRQLRQKLRPSVAELKRRVTRADLVEAHDITAPDPDFLICLKSISGTVPVPRHWGRKRKYLQGKRGFEKPPFQLPDFILKTGISALRDGLLEVEANRSAKQANRARVAPKMGAMDVDYRTLYDAFFQHQTKPTNLTKLGDLYYEGKDLETRNRVQPGKKLSDKLKDALGMTAENMPPPWLINMQRYGPPPSYPSLKIPGLNAPLPSTDCQYGYHVGGWGKPPVDTYGRPLYGGNPFDPPGTNADSNIPKEGLVTSDGKALSAQSWGGLPTGEMYYLNRDEEEDDEDDMEESSDDEEEDNKEQSVILEEGEEPSNEQDATELSAYPKAGLTDLRKGIETPIVESNGQKKLYTILEERKVSLGGQVFGSDIQYVVPGGAESVLAKTTEVSTKAKKSHTSVEDEDDLDKNFKF